MNKKDKLYTLIAFSASVFILFIFYHKALLHLNDYVFSNSGDGIKNYYTYLFHAKYDNSFFEFTGMNYPFQENIIYTDAHPLLSYLVGKLGLANYGIGILNFLMLISYPISTIFIYKILKHFNVNTLWSIFASVAISFMAPQVFRLTGHFSMSYAFAIPILWYLLIKTTTFQTIKWNIITACYLIVFFFTHPYLGLILSSFSFAYWFVLLLLTNKINYSLKTFVLNIGLQVILPILFFQVLVLLNDSHLNRLQNPRGFYEMFASYESLLIAHHGPMIFLNQLFDWESGNWESWSYLGVTAILFSLIIIGYYLLNRKSINVSSQFKKPLFIFCIAAFIVLLFSMCIPFKWDKFKWIIDILTPLKQFRVLGRFSWVFFYVFSISILVLLYKIKEKLKSKFLINGLFYIGIILYFIEFTASHNYVSSEITKTKNPFKIQYVDADMKSLIDFTSKSNFDAIIFLPFTHMSSENVQIIGGEQSVFDALILSYHTKTKLLNTISSRTSLTEAIAMINLFSPDYIEKSIAKLLQNKKILLVKNNNELDINESRMVERSKMLFQNSTFKAYNFLIDDWNNSTEFNTVIKSSKLATYKLKDNWFSDTTTWFYYDSFDTKLNKNAMTGPGAFSEIKNGWNKLIQLNSEYLTKGNYEVSFWYNLKIGMPDVLAVAEKITPDTLEWVDRFMIRETNLVVNDWAFVKLNFSFNPTDTVNILLTSGPSNELMVIDELLIRKINGLDIYKHGKINNSKNEYLIKNNYWINKNSFSH